jgi:enoyl-CoA hydratase
VKVKSGEAFMRFEDYKTLAFERRGKVLTIIINRPESYNSVNGALHDELATVFSDVADDPDSDVIVLTGAGKSFCAGGDMEWFQSMIDNPRIFERLAPHAKRIVYSLIDLEKPIICRLNGPAAGLGASIALLCDIIIASTKASIGDPHVKMGLVAGDGGAVIWAQLVGYVRAKEYLLTGKMMPAAEMERIGLVNAVVPPEELDARVYDLADELANGARQAIRWTKAAVNIPLRDIANQVMDACMGYETVTNSSKDHQEAVRAFVEKRPAKFVGE